MENSVSTFTFYTWSREGDGLSLGHTAIQQLRWDLHTDILTPSHFSYLHTFEGRRRRTKLKVPSSWSCPPWRSSDVNLALTGFGISPSAGPFC